MTHSRANPSTRYTELVGIYKELHEKGDKRNDIAPEHTFDGRSLIAHVNTITQAVVRYELRSLLDYGCGKAVVYDLAQAKARDGRKLRGLREIWGIDDIRLFDPGYAPFSEPPTGTYDGVICTDVLEHCPEEDIDWIIEDLFGFARKFLFMTIACYPAEKALPTGENAHVTQKNPGWWLDHIDAVAATRPQVEYIACLTLRDKRQMVVQGGGPAGKSS